MALRTYLIWTSLIRTSWVALLASMTLASVYGAEDSPPPLAGMLNQSLRGPVSLAISGERLWVANRTSSTLSEVDLSTQQVVAEHECAGGAAAVYPHPNGGVYLLDDQRHTLVHFDPQQPKAETVIARVAPHPVRMTRIDEAELVIVASLWGRALTIVDTSEDATSPSQRIPLAFAPRELIVLDAAKQLVLVGDAFGGKLAVVDIGKRSIRHAFDLPIQNIRGMALSRDKKEVVFTHQLLDPKIWGERDSVHWGLLLANSLRGVKVSDLLNPQADLMTASWLDAIGAVGEGGGDPEAVLVDSERTIVVIAGVNQVLVDAQSYRQRFDVGRRPSAITASGDTLYVANRFDDSITVIDLRTAKKSGEIRLGPQRDLTAAERGERLFYDARLSLAGWMSCHSCHSDGHSTGKLADTLGDGDYGASKRILSLLGVRQTGPWGWTAGSQSLPEQVKKSVRTTMHGRALAAEQVNDLVAFLKQLSPPPSMRDTIASRVERGRELFAKNNCSDCHVAPLYTSNETYDVKLRDAHGNRKFNPPSLRGVSQRDAFFHDGRYKSLRDVVRKARHQLEQPLSSEDEEALLAFLQSL